MKLRTLIVDDEGASRRALEIQLAEVEDVEVIGTADDGPSALDMISALSPDLVFLDVEMPDLDGFEVLRQLAPEDMPRVVFVTAHEEFALQAFDVEAVDYLLKPVDDRMLDRALERVRSKAARQEGVAIRGTPHRTRLLVKRRDAYAFVQVHDIIWIEAEGNYARLHMPRESHLIRTSLNHLEQVLSPEAFLRIHRSAIVHLDRVASIQPRGVSDYQVVLSDGRTIPVGRSYRDRLLQHQE